MKGPPRNPATFVVAPVDGVNPPPGLLEGELSRKRVHVGHGLAIVVVLLELGWWLPAEGGVDALVVEPVHP